MAVTEIEVGKEYKVDNAVARAEALTSCWYNHKRLRIGAWDVEADRFYLFFTDGTCLHKTPSGQQDLTRHRMDPTRLKRVLIELGEEDAAAGRTT